MNEKKMPRSSFDKRNNGEIWEIAYVFHGKENKNWTKKKVMMIEWINYACERDLLLELKIRRCRKSENWQ